MLILSPTPFVRRDKRQFSWYQRYSGFRHLLTTEVLSSPTGGRSLKEAHVLILGAGNDTLGEDMIADGWTGGIVNTDWSEVVVSEMRKKYGDGRFKMAFDVADVTSSAGLPYGDGSFDLVIAKGVVDSVLCSAGPIANIRTLMAETYRVLQEGGSFFTVTYGNKDSRLVYYENAGAEWWRGLSIFSIPKPPPLHFGFDFNERYSREPPHYFVIVAHKDGGVPSEGRPGCAGYGQSSNVDDVNMSTLSDRLHRSANEDASLNISSATI